MTTTTRTDASFAVLRTITAAADLHVNRAEPIRLAENDLWRIHTTQGRAVVRIARAGQETAAAREVAVARWLAEHALPAVRPLPLAQPVHADGRCATFWEELPPHRPGTETQLATLLRQLHHLPEPPFSIGTLDPFVRIADRIRAARSVGEADRRWLLRRLDTLRQAWNDLPAGQPHRVAHGDAWNGNVAATDSGTAYLLDFERTSIGRPEWDLASVAVDYDTFGILTDEAYRRFCAAYGADVMTWPGYPTLRGIRELRKVTFALQIADEDPTATEQAHHRLACIRGLNGPRPWGWSAVA